MKAWLWNYRGWIWSDLDQILAQEFTLIPLPALEEGWGGLSNDAATVAYLEANSAVHYLIDRFGMSQVRELLLHLKAKQAPLHSHAITTLAVVRTIPVQVGRSVTALRKEKLICSGHF